MSSESEVTQSCPTLCDPVDCSPPGFSIHGILQARTLEWGAIAFSRGSSWPRDWTWVSCIGGRGFTLCATREALMNSSVAQSCRLCDPMNRSTPGKGFPFSAIYSSRKCIDYYLLGDNSLVSLFWCSNYARLIQREPLWSLLCLLDIVIILNSFPYFVVQQDVPGSLVQLPCPSLGIRHSSKEPWFFLVQNGIQKPECEH